MENVKFYSWLCIIVVLLICSIRTEIQTGVQCDPQKDKPTPNPKKECSFYHCQERDPTSSWVLINCTEAEYFGALNNQCLKNNGDPCNPQPQPQSQSQPSADADALAYDSAPAQAAPSLSLSFGARRAAAPAPGPY